MGSTTSQNQNQQETSRRSTTSSSSLKDYSPQFESALKTYQSTAAPVNLRFNDRPFSSGFDPVVQSAMSQGVANIKGQEANQNRQLATTLNTAGTGNNGALLGALQRLSQFNSSGNINALQPAALQQQREYDVAKAGILDANNKLRLAQAQQNTQSQQGLLGILGELMKAGARKTVSERGTGFTTSQGETHKGFF